MHRPSVNFGNFMVTRKAFEKLFLLAILTRLYSMSSAHPFQHVSHRNHWKAGILVCLDISSFCDMDVTHYQVSLRICIHQNFQIVVTV